VQAAPPVQSTPFEALPNKVTVSQPPIQEPIVENTNQLTLNFNVSEKEDLLNQIEILLKKINFNTKQIEELNNKFDKIIDNISTNSLPIKKRAKKKSVDKKREI
jgi:DNA-dependent RNA polymerase auxiliary subunit epsilon